MIQAIKWNKVIYHSQVQLILTDMTQASDTVIKHERIGWSINACPKVFAVCQKEQNCYDVRKWLNVVEVERNVFQMCVK